MNRLVTVCGSTVGIIGREQLRLPAFSVPTFTMPALLYLFFGALSGSRPTTSTGAAMELLGYCGFAVLGVALFSFGAGLALERVSAWEQFQRTLPVPAFVRYAARVAVVLAFSLASLVPLLVVGLVSSDAPAAAVLSAANLLPLLLGVGVFSALGTALGYWLPVRGAVPLTNLVYLLLSYAGGMLGTAPGHRLDRWALLPTTQWNDLLVGTAVRHHAPSGAVLGLVVWLVVLSGVALAGYRRVQRESFR
jgi:ABC-2 type transport system permease protein